MLVLLMLLLWWLNRLATRHERTRARLRYRFDDHGRLAGVEQPPSDVRECCHCGRPIVSEGNGRWIDRSGRPNCPSKKRAHDVAA